MKNGKAQSWVVFGIMILVVVMSFVISQRELGDRQQGQLVDLGISELRSACNDTDRGITPFYKGDIKGRSSRGKEISQQDTCESNDVIEYYCLAGEVEQARFVCVNGCQAGACVLGSSE